MNVPIWVVWKDLIFIVYWPIWVVPLYIWARKKHLKNRWAFLVIAILLCFSLKYLLAFSLGEVFFNSESAKIKKFVDENFGVLINAIFFTTLLIPVLFMHLSAKAKYFYRTIASSGAQRARAH
ncbi:MAG: hypothetical protein AB1442_07740 [Nitrospirota bacterium]